jgi:hypothetical protein
MFSGLVLIFLYLKPNGVLGEGPPQRRASDDDDDDLAPAKASQTGGR